MFFFAFSLSFLVLLSSTTGEHNLSNGNDRWQKYLDQIENAVGEYKECNQDDCSCHADVIEKDLAPFRDGITEELFQKTKGKGTRYQIINHKLYRETKCMFPFRCSGVEYFILEIINKLPDMELAINVRDWPQAPTRGPLLPTFSFSKVAGQSFDIMYPAWAFHSGGPFLRVYPEGLGNWMGLRHNLAAAAVPWEQKDDKAFFRGSRTTHERDPLILLSREEPDLVEASYTKNQAWKSDKDTLGAPPAQDIKLEAHCKYRYLFNFRGVAASFRLKHLFLCDSLVFHVGDEWLEFFYPALKPWVHYVPVQQDLKDARELIKFAQANQEVAQQIAQRGRQFIWDHLRMEDVSCYWEKLLKKYATLLKFKPKRDTSLNLITAKVRHDEL